MSGSFADAVRSSMLGVHSVCELALRRLKAYARRIL